MARAMNPRGLLVAGVLCALVVPTTASVQIYTEAGLGFPVPEPVETADPIAGFRTYNGLVMALDELTLDSPLLTETVIGKTLEDRDILGYTLTGTEETGPGGETKAAVFITGTTHAREWASPEIAVRFIEELIEGHDDDPFATWLLDHLEFAIVPVLNVDGFLRTQHYFDRRWTGNRDGRQRRKNNRNVTAPLEAGEDHLLGVDLNRNFSAGWGGSGSSSLQTSILYRGPAPFSEPESQALRDSVPVLLTDPARMRAYLDVHGAIPLLYYILANQPAFAELDAWTTEVASRMQQTYEEISGVPGAYALDGITPPYAGVADEYFSVTYSVPAITIEYPPPRYRVGGSSASVFMLPDDEVLEVVEENIAAMKLASMLSVGPPILEEILVWRDLDSSGTWSPGESVYRAAWSTATGGATRILTIHQEGTLEVGTEYRVLLRFDRPMRREGTSGPAGWPGQNVAPQPQALLFPDGLEPATAVLPVADGWHLDAEAPPGPSGFSRYAGDTWEGVFTMDDEAASALLEVEVHDAAGRALDACPATVADFDAGWTGYGDSACAGNAGGTDRTFTLPLVPTTSANSWIIFED